LRQAIAIIPEAAQGASRRFGMADTLNLAMLICASLGAMAFGILSAYAVLRVGFVLMRPRKKPAPVKAQTEAARIS